jgi:hypothetical protein
MLKYSFFLISFTVLLFNLKLSAQITFEKTFGTVLTEEAKSIRQTVDGGYIIGGTNLVKIDEYGVEEWSKPYPSLFANLTSDSGYILITSSSPDIFFTKVDAIGDTLWQTNFREGVWANEGNYIEQTEDGGFIVTGRFQSVTGSGMMLLKLSSTGNKVWRRAFSEATSAGFCEGYSVQQTSDKGYILTGTSYINYYDSTRNEDVFIVKTDSLGNEQWRRFFGGSNDDAGYSVRQDNANNYLIAGRTNSYNTNFGSNMYLIKLDSNGDSLWTNTYGGDYMETATGLWLTKDNGYILSGSSNTFSNGDFDGYVVKTDNNGDTLWTNHYGGIGIDALSSVQETSDNGYVLAGMTNSMGAGGLDMYVLKTDSLGNVLNQNSIANNNGINLNVRIYPNPSRGRIVVSSNEKYSSIQIINVLGKTIYANMSPSLETSIDLSKHEKGIYLYQIKLNKPSSMKSGKIVIE